MKYITEKKDFLDSPIVFDEASHTYTNLSGTVYTSATQYIKYFSPEFDPLGKIIKACAKRDGYTVEELDRIWKEKARMANEYGTEVHNFLENCLLSHFEMPFPQDTFYLNQEDYLHLYNGLKNVMSAEISKSKHKFFKIHPESRVSSDKYKIAGTIDFLVEVEKDVFWIFDYKTNAVIEKDHKIYGSMEGVFDFIPSNAYHKYKFQLSLYSHLLELQGYKVERICLFHIPKTDSNDPNDWRPREIVPIELDLEYLDFFRKNGIKPISYYESLKDNKKNVDLFEKMNYLYENFSKNRNLSEKSVVNLYDYVLNFESSLDTYILADSLEKMFKMIKDRAKNDAIIEANKIYQYSGDSEQKAYTFNNNTVQVEVSSRATYDYSTDESIVEEENLLKKKKDLMKKACYEGLESVEFINEETGEKFVLSPAKVKSRSDILSIK